MRRPRAGRCFKQSSHGIFVGNLLLVPIHASYWTAIGTSFCSSHTQWSMNHRLIILGYSNWGQPERLRPLIRDKVREQNSCDFNKQLQQPSHFILNKHIDMYWISESKFVTQLNSFLAWVLRCISLLC